ncbi:MAG TPA: hypothetical protein VGB75_02945 [Jatrophihabitans sp.]|uniref:hypothetical protein n=1 Tax=Jatrophihabitans sp. TaxID=1932789 RepID=UPI002F1061CC
MNRVVSTVATIAGGAVVGVFAGQIATAVSGNRMAPWIVGRATGLAAYLLMVLLVLAGLLLSHPWRAEFGRPSTLTRIRVHAALAAAAFVMTGLHIAVLATDHHAGVGWAGVLAPMGSQYRPVPVTLGLLGMWLGLAAGITAALAPRIGPRAWWPVHKVAILSIVGVWAHAVLAGTDSAALLTWYLVTAGLVIAVAASRYLAISPQRRGPVVGQGT